MTNEWRDISTAPTDGTWILGVRSPGFMSVIQWTKYTKTNWRAHVKERKGFHATHWQPLPVSPIYK